MLVIARGEAVRNFLYSDTLKVLNENARVTLLSAITDEQTIDRFAPLVDRLVPLEAYPESARWTDFSYVLHMAHYRWLDSQAAKYQWQADYQRAKTRLKRFRLIMLKGMALAVANRTALEALTPLERELAWRLRPTRDFERLFTELQPDLVFNCSHIHGPLADLPMRVAYRLGFPTAAFIFSWDNLYSRSRIFVPYHDYLVWTESIRQHFFEIYPQTPADHVYVTGTPQFDFHFKPEYHLEREDLCTRLGIDPSRPYILYTTGYSKDFNDEHKILEEVIHFVQETELQPKPQLVVRTYLKGNSPEMVALSHQDLPDVIFPAVQWERRWLTPLYEDIFTYTNLLRHTALGINAASTVSLELMMHGKPVINLGFEPPGSRLAHWTRFSRHVEYEHYLPVIQSGAVMVARSIEDLRAMITRGLTQPQANHPAQEQFLKGMFDDTLDGQSGKRIAKLLLLLSKTRCPTKD